MDLDTNHWRDSQVEAFILSIQLYAGGPVLRYRVADCEAGVVWVHEAWDWAKRSGVPIEKGPLYGCGPVDNWQVVRTHR